MTVTGLTRRVGARFGPVPSPLERSIRWERSHGPSDLTHDRPELADPDDELTLFQRYLREVSSTPLLSAEEETGLARSIEAGAYAAELSGRAEQTGRSPPRAAAEELAEIARAGHLVKNRMIRANLRLVVGWRRSTPTAEGRSST